MENFGYNKSTPRDFVITGTPDIPGASDISQAAYYEAILKVPGTSLYNPASTAFVLQSTLFSRR